MPKPGVKPTIADRMKAGKKSRPKEPVWKGPEIDGVTQSMVKKFMTCRERFRILVVEGLKKTESFEATLEYGQIWHSAEEAFAGNKNWVKAVEVYRKVLYGKYPFQRDVIDHWVGKCLVQFPVYIEFWKKHPDVVNRTPIFQEQKFDVTYTTPSGRKVRLRGKWDAVDFIDKKNRRGETGIYLGENKTKSQIDTVKIGRQLRFDLQTMMYLLTIRLSRGTTKEFNKYEKFPVAGVRYNVIRRAGHKSPESMMTKIEEDLSNDRGGEWFSRWDVPVSEKEIDRFRRECLDPLLEQIQDWWDMIKACHIRQCTPWDLHGNNIHWRHPYGGRNMLDEGGFGDVDNYIEDGSMTGLRRVTNLYPELE